MVMLYRWENKIVITRNLGYDGDNSTRPWTWIIISHNILGPGYNYYFFNSFKNLTAHYFGMEGLSAVQQSYRTG